jgi:hypothetical protein
MVKVKQYIMIPSPDPAEKRDHIRCPENSNIGGRSQCSFEIVCTNKSKSGALCETLRGKSLSSPEKIKNSKVESIPLLVDEKKDSMLGSSRWDI